ncbi:hypothetical protein EJB05_20545, partial [Eragrostis curvula]
MQGGGTRVLLTSSGVRRYKVLVPWRFGYVHPEIKQGDVFDPVQCRGLSVTWSDRVPADEELCSCGDGKVSMGGGIGIGGDCSLDSLGDNADEGGSMPNDSNFIYSEGLENNAVATEPVGEAQPSKLQGFQCDGTAESNSVGKDFISVGFRAGDSTVPGCRKGRKAVVPWRFKIGYKPKWSLGMCPGDGSNGQTEGTDGSKQSACAMASNPSGVEVSAARKRSSVKVQKGTGSVPKKRKTYKDHNHQAVPKSRISLVRENVLTTLREFRVIYKKLLEIEETKWKERGHELRPDLAAFNIYKERYCVEYDEKRYVGSIPEVQIGDIFNSSMELSVVGIHHAQLLPVDYIKKDGTCLAVSIVSYAQPSVSSNNFDFLLHVGSMAATSDQKIEDADLALKHSMDTGMPVRVIHAIINEPSDNVQSKQLASYVYGGLFLVEKLCIEKIKGEQCVNTFHLRRMAGQQHIDIYEVLRTRSPEPFNGIFVDDISGGLEKMPISVINTISNEYPMALRYISQIQYPLKYQPNPPSGCNCVGGCSFSKNCACAVKNGGMFPFSHIGLLEDRPLIYECGPSCKCPPTCHNRVSQHGIKFRLQVFKTKSMGWGVRCLDFIPSGSFVCEYIGEILEDQEAQERMSDEYLFAAGNNYYIVPRWKGLCKKIPSLQDGPSEDEEIVFAVDAVSSGNFARYINHGCTPNLFPQNVLFDHDDKRMPHIMFFATEDIPPLKELSYDYNYGDEVYDSDGNIKKKQCFCGSVECTGWFPFSEQVIYFCWIGTGGLEPRSSSGSCYHWPKFQIIGCYAQTELGHGSNAQGLETTAFFFIPRPMSLLYIHSPTLTSSKWWLGESFHSCSCLWSTDNRRKGLHPSKALSRAVCIVVRYSAIRKQFGSQVGSPETLVLNYKIQQRRLFPLLASAYAFRLVADWLKWLYTNLTQRLEAKDFSPLQYVHACTAGLKADAIEECRKLFVDMVT